MRPSICVVACMSGLAAAAPFRLAQAFSSNMVLQHGVTSRVWGWASVGQTVYGSLFNEGSNASVPVATSADATGLFVLALPPMPANRDAYTLTVSTAPISDRCNLYAYSCDGASLAFTGILFGDVIFCTGQSNMQVNVGFAFNATEELNAANALSGFVRIFQASASVQSKDVALDDLAAIQIPWSAASNTSLPEFSATCWYTAKAIVASRPSEAAGVMLGLVATTWGGTPIKAWTSPKVNAKCMDLYPYPPNGPAGDCGEYHAPCNVSALYNSMIAPFTVGGGMAVSSAIWFQGENDMGEIISSSEYPFYACQLAGLADDLRASLSSPGAHWTTVQLAPYDAGTDIPYFRDMQCKTTAGLLNASCAVIVDDGDPLSPIGSVHSRNKQLVGRRVAAGIIPALYGTTGGRAQSTGPAYAGATFGATPDGAFLYANVSFTAASLGPGGTLVFVPPHIDAWQNASRCPYELPEGNGHNITAGYCDWFNIQGSNGVFYNATAVESITLPDGSVGLALTSPVVPAPIPGLKATGSRFGWNQWPVVNWYNTYGFPVVPWNVTG